jgi:Ca-activated chloride channel family protein
MSSRAFRLVALIVAVAVVIGAVILRGGGSSTGSTTAAQTTSATPAPPANAVTITVAYSPEKEALVKPALAAFTATHPVVDGAPIVVKGLNVSSGAALDALRAGTLKPTIWTPASSLWGRLLTELADVSWVPRDNPKLARSPVVIAMWEDEARALGWPAKPLGWADVLAEARSSKGWAAHGHPEWGSFRLGHTNPDFSTSGLSAVAAEYYAATGKTEGLTLDDLARPDVRAQIRAIEGSIVHYGDTTLFFADQLAAKGPAFASAVAMEESTLVDFNVRLRKGGPRLVGIYPKEGTFFSDHPLISLTAPWVTPAQHAAAAQLIAFLGTAAVQSRITALGFRPATPDTPLDGNLTAANGVDAAQPTRVLSLPEPKVLGRIRALWHEDRKPADIALVLDISGSMNDEGKLDQAKAGLHAFLKQLSSRDRVSLTTFSDQPTTIVPLEELSPANLSALDATIDGLFAGGGTAVFDASLASLDLLAASGDPKHIEAAVILTDGQDNRSRSTVTDVVHRLSAQTEEGGVRVFTIAYGSDADGSGLAAIAKAGGGKPYVGDPQTINAVYTSISSFF